MRLTIFTLLFVLCFSVKAQIPQQISGNWINQNTNDWEYGFFEDFAIYNCGFWDYQSVETKAGGATFTLRQGDNIVNLEIDTKSDGVVTIKNGKQKAQEYVLMKNQYPSYKTKDTNPFPTPGFKQDSVTIVGYYRNLDKIPQEFEGRLGHNYFEIGIPGFIVDVDVKYRTAIDPSGRFSITVPIVNTQEAYTDWQRMGQMTVLQPNDTLFLFADMADFIPQESDGSLEEYKGRRKQILFMGKNARLNNEIIQYGNQTVASISRREEVEKGVTNMALLSKLEDVYNKRINHLDDYASQHIVSDKFVTYKKESLKYDFAFNLMQHRFDLRRENRRFEEGYMEYVNKVFPLFNKNVYTLVRSYRGFLRDYVGYANDVAGTKTFTIDLEMIGKILENEGKMTPETKTQITEYNKLIQQIQATTDTAQRRKLVESGSGLFKNVNSNDLIIETARELASELLLKRELAAVDSIINEPVLSEWYIASSFYKMLDNGHKPLSTQSVKLFEEKVANPFLREQIMSLHNTYVEITEQTLDNESLKNTVHLAAINNPDELFNKLIEPYKGKVIYVDFWGTWCSPCRENMALAGAVEDALHGEDVVFMYFANNSPELSWKNIIKEMNLTGKNIVHYRLPVPQQSMIEQKFSINSFPTYMIIDKDGKVVNGKAPSPREKDKLVADIRSLLN